MTPILTTITPYWKRPEMLRSWVRALRYASQKGVRHFVYFVGEPLPDWWEDEIKGLPIVAMLRAEEPGLSIGHYHNLGAEQANSPWIMKLDVDAFPNTAYFGRLLPILESAGEREWFNGGMFYLNKYYSDLLLTADKTMPLGPKLYQQIMANRSTYGQGGYLLPAASNFICRRDVYLRLGGCDSRFRGYGWEDYQQIAMLEAYQQGANPLPGPIGLNNVTQRCRDEISRPKARQLWERDAFLCLIHKWHPGATDPNYKGHQNRNKEILLERVLQLR